MKPRVHRAFTSFLVFAWVGGCGSPQPATVVAPDPPPDTAVAIPAGIDSSVAEYADSVAGDSFVALEAQDRASALQQTAQTLIARSDSLWRNLPSVGEVAARVSPDEEAQATQAATNGAEALLELDRLLRDSAVTPEALANVTAVLLDSAESTLERAYELNPFDTRSRLWLARVYELQARRLGRDSAYRRAIDELERLARLSPDQHTVFAMLANNHYYLEEWNPAAEHYRTAREVYLVTYDLVPEAETPIDSGLLFTYSRAEAEMRLQDLDADGAVAAFAVALRYARTADDSAYVRSELDWMAWDDMNVLSSFTRDSLVAVEQAGDVSAAADGYRRLLPTLTAPGAIDEIEWRLAIAEYNLGETEAAADRLRRLVTRTAVDSTGQPVDSTYARYLEDYGTVCLNLGRTYLHERRDNRTALMYFEQATRVVWPGRPVAHLEVALLLRNNVDAALENARAALDNEAELTDDQRRDLYRLLMTLYRRTGEFDLARRYRDAYRGLTVP